MFESINGGLVICNVLMFAILVGFGWLYTWERRKGIEREQELLGAVLAQHAGDYIGVVDALRTKPKDKLAQMQAENELAVNAQKLSKMEGLPVS